MRELCEEYKDKYLQLSQASCWHLRHSIVPSRCLEYMSPEEQDQWEVEVKNKIDELLKLQEQGFYRDRFKEE